jgi:hypothetical protein
VRVSIQTPSEALLKSLEDTAPEGVAITILPLGNRRGVSPTAAEMLAAIISVTSSVSLGVVANWLHEHLKGATAPTVVNNITIDNSVIVNISALEKIIDPDA